ncbi:Cytochrome c551 peroxidase [hydrothermal vent metagenome]|uniref:Cytochrome c551 peroxidase n=1 Tax=hydrothermal vent metagenome TaxID=652676 RepID=A0A3B1B7I3_9ZZZZ
MKPSLWRPKKKPSIHPVRQASNRPLKSAWQGLCCLFVTSLPGINLANHNEFINIAITPAYQTREPILPLPAIPRLDPAKVALGKKLFFDVRLSASKKLSCASCHDLSSNGADYQVRSRGHDNATLAVNTPSIFNATLNPWQFWDGRADSLEEQINQVIENPREMANSWPVIIRRLKNDPAYQRKFRRLYTDGISAENIRNAITAFENTLLTPDSRFDRWLQGDKQALNAEQKKGYRLFKDYGCAACHQGVNVGGNLFQKVGIFADYFQHRDEIQLADYGRFNVTGRKQDQHVFRVPSLRNVEVTAPYFHDGSVNTLHEVIRLVARYQLGRTIPEDDIKSIITFLKTLTGKYKGRRLTQAHAP